MDSQIFHSPRAWRCKYCGAEILWLQSRNTTWYAVKAYWQPSLKWYAGSRTDFHKCGSLDTRKEQARPPDRLGSGKLTRDKKRHKY